LEKKITVRGFKYPRIRARLNILRADQTLFKLARLYLDQPDFVR
jgi:hypothetical protein